MENPNAHLMHIGSWLVKEFKLGRPVAGTGLWSCCGKTIQMSIYCTSIQSRKTFPKELMNLKHEKDVYEDSSTEEFKSRVNRRKQILQHHIENSQKLEDYRETPQIVVKSEDDEIMTISDTKLTKEEEALKLACSKDSTFNAPMLVAWLIRHHEEEPTTINGLSFLLKHLETGEGCYLMQRHGVMAAVLRIQRFYSKYPNHNASILLSVLTVMARLLDCNYTRSLLLEPSTPNAENADPEGITTAAFSIAHCHMNSRAHMDAALRCLAQCCRSEPCRALIIHRNYVPYTIQGAKPFLYDRSIARNMLRLLNWLSTDADRMQVVCRQRAVELALSVLRRHSADRPVVGVAAAFLARAATSEPAAMQVVLARKAVPDVIQALRVVHDDEGVQRALLLLLQALAKTSEGFRQIDATRGGWQTACQGTALGDALMHALPGPLNNSGWCLGDSPHQSGLEMQAAQAKRVAQERSAVQLGPRSNWTSSSLQEFMGMSLKGQTLAINNDRRTVFFELISTLDLLPKVEMHVEGLHHAVGIVPDREGREAWFQRVKEYEKQNGLQLDEMVATVVDMRRREAQQKLHQQLQAEQTMLNAEEQPTLLEAIAKPLFVQGVLITSKSLAEGEVSIEERMRKLMGTDGGDLTQPDQDSKS